jgi:UDP-galactopyranose mutase
MANILVVGAGFAGAVYARCLAEAGHEVHVIECREHIAGNCFDRRHSTGVRVHQYGPHLFHTSNLRVVDWLSRFTDWVSYEHRVVARIGQDLEVPLPVNVRTVCEVFGRDFAGIDEVEAFLRSQAEPKALIETAEDFLHATLGRRLTDLFFAPYTRKMWGIGLNEVDPSVVRRVQVRVGDDDRYFPADTFQAMPRNGYTAVFAEIFRHPRINVSLSTRFDHAMLDRYEACFNSMPIDEFFDFRFGELPYRSIRFEHEIRERAEAPRHVTVNYTDAGPYTRETWWHNIPGHDTKSGGTQVIRTREEPCDYRENGYERYYPIKTSDGRFDSVYRRYEAEAEHFKSVKFIGRCGTYQYLDMHQVINQSLVNVTKIISQGGVI